jgi:hypothetical protein
MTWTRSGLLTATAKFAVIVMLLVGTSQRLNIASVDSQTETLSGSPKEVVHPVLTGEATHPSTAALNVPKPTSTERAQGRRGGGGAECSTKGKSADEHDTGNDVVDNDASLKSLQANPTWTSFFNKAFSGSGYFTRVERGSQDKSSSQCYYRATRVCVRHGAVYFVRPKKRAATDSKETWLGTGVTPQSSSGTLRLCNELRPKINFKFFVVDESPVEGRPPIGFRDAGPGSKAHMTSCWQYYGYHLVQCVATAFAVQATHGFVEPLKTAPANRNVTLLLFNHAISLPQAAREHFSHAMYIGSSADWRDPGPRAGPKSRPGYRAAPLWPLWSQSTSSPRAVVEAFKFPVDDAEIGRPEGLCFDKFLFGHPNHNSVPALQRRGHALHLAALFGTQPKPKGRRIVIAQRGAGKTQGSRQFTNVNAIAEVLRREYGSAGYQVDIIDWATLSFQQQFDVASTTDVLLTMHGAGNSWIAAMKPRTVVIETWPQCVVRNVYLVMAKQYNVRYYSLCLGLPQSAPEGSVEAKFSFLHQSVTVPLEKVMSTMLHAVAYLDAVRDGCR